MGLHLQKALVLVLAAEVDGGAHALGELADAAHAAVDAHATAAVGAHAAADHAAVRVAAAHIEAPLYLEAACALAHGARVGALPHQKLDGG